jgi:hypothetical protein
MKTALFAFNGDPVCFVHVLLNAFDLVERGDEVKIVIEGSATKLIETFESNPTAPFAPLFEKAIKAGLIDCACKACSVKMGSQKSAERQGFVLCDEMSGHPAIGRYLRDGYRVITF